MRISGDVATAKVLVGTQVKTQSGFSAVDLLLMMGMVVAIAAVAMPTFIKQTERAKITRAKADLDGFSQKILQLKSAEKKTLMSLTGSSCSLCEAGVAPGAQLGPEHSQKSLEAWKKLGFDSTPLDPWGNPYLLDENENEFEDCRLDSVYSAGPNGIWAGSGDGDDVFDDDLIARSPTALLPRKACTAPTSPQFGGT